MFQTGGLPLLPLPQPADPDDDSGVVVQAKRKGRGRRNSYQEMTDDVGLC